MQRNNKKQVYESTVFFGNIITVRIKNELVKDINKTMKLTSPKYDSISHFIRCAITKQLREDKKELAWNDIKPKARS